MIKTVVADATHFNGVADLHMIGVHEYFQQRAPSNQSFPQEFNPQTKDVWVGLLSDEDFKRELRSLPHLDDKWMLAMRRFLSMCNERGLTPRFDITDQALNDHVIRFLQHARIKMCDFAQRTGLFSRVRIASTFRDYSLSHSSFTVNAWARCRTVLDPGFEAWLRKAPLPRFQLRGNSTYYRVVEPNISFWVRYLNTTQVSIGYTVKCPSKVSVPGDRYANRKEVDAYLDKIWLPIVRSHRFIQLPLRLF